MKKYAGSLAILIVFMFMISGALQPVFAMGWNPGKDQNKHVNQWDDRGDNPGTPGVQSVPDSATTLACLGLGLAGIGGYLLMRNRKDKSASRCS